MNNKCSCITFRNLDDAASNDNTEMNGVENQGVEELDNDIINQEVDDVECPEEKKDIESTEGKTVSIAQGCGETENERTQLAGKPGTIVQASL